MKVLSILSKVSAQFGGRDENSLTLDEILSFLIQTNQGTLLQARCTKQEASYYAK